MRLMRGLLMSLLLLDLAVAQTATVKRTVNLWPSPSIGQEPVGRLTPSMRLRLLESSPTDGFYHVKTEDGKEGWVLGGDIVIQTPSSPAAGATPHSNGTDSASAKHERERREAEARQEMEKARRAAEQAWAARDRAAKESQKAKIDEATAEHTNAPKKMAGSAKSHDQRREAVAHLPSATPLPTPIQRQPTTRTAIPAATMSRRQITSDRSSSQTETGKAQTDEDRLQQAIDSIKLGQEVFHHLEEMELRKPETVQVRISHDLQEDLTKGFSTQGLTERDQIPVSTVMKVHLAGDPYFDVKPISDERQLVTKDKPNEWSFTVVPLKGGKWPLHMLITAVIHTPWGTDEYKDFPVKDEVILVRVTPLSFTKSFFIENWQWLWTAIFIPAVALFWKRRHSKTKTKPSSASVAA